MEKTRVRLDLHRRRLPSQLARTIATITESGTPDAFSFLRASRDDPETLHSINSLAATLAYERRYAEAERMERELLDIRRRVLGPEHPDTGIPVYNLEVRGQQPRVRTREKPEPCRRVTDAD